MIKQNYEIGMVGLGVMGRNLLLNMANHDYSVAGFDLDNSKVEALRKEAGERDVQGVNSMPAFIRLLKLPRAVMLLIPAGKPVDAVIQDLLPHMQKGDLIIDGGNSFFKDTDMRAKMLAEKKVDFLGVGISGGEQGARFGPSIMPGGAKKAYERVRPLFEAIAAKVDDEPCVAYLGPGSAGHYVKMVHNGIEYGLMQLIAETYDLMKRGLALTDDELHEVYNEWNKAELQSFLLEITANIFKQVDEKTGKRLVDVILDQAKQKGTGMWASQSAMELQAPVPTIDMAVAMRDLSGYKAERETAAKRLSGSGSKFSGKRDEFIRRLKNTLYASMILTYAQGMALLRRASAHFEYGLDPEAVASIWRGGCIIRAALLEDIRRAYRGRPDLANLLLDPAIGQAVLERQNDMRNVVKTAADLGLPVPAIMASLAYFDSYRSAWLPANLIQAQRDYFGAHTYERIDMIGVFHSEWSSE